jgi:transketolase
MRERFTTATTDLLDKDPHVAVVLADIGVSQFRESGAMRRHPDRVINVGIREQLMIGVGAGLALEGFKPIIHTYAPFLVERPFEQVKLDFAHQDVAVTLVSIGASFDWVEGGRTHMAPGDVALMRTLPGWDIFVPGHPDEAEAALRIANRSGRRSYIRLSTQQNRTTVPDAVEGLVVVRPAQPGSPLVIAVGPTLDNVLAATEGLGVAVAYTAAVRPIDAAGLRRVADTDVILVEPYLEGTSAHAITTALNDRAVRLTSLGVGTDELRHYGSPTEHEAAWGLDPAGLRHSIHEALDQHGNPHRYAAF